MKRDSNISFGRLIASYRALKRWSSQELANRVGVSRKTISDIENDHRDPARIQASLFQKIIHILEIPEDETPRLFTDESDRESLNDRHKNCMSENQKGDVDYIPARRIPVINLTSCGGWEDWGDMDYPVGHADDYSFGVSDDANAFYVRAHGDSMWPEIREGDLVLIEPNQAVNSGDIVFVRTQEGCVIKKLHRSDGRITLLSLNSEYPPIDIKERDDLRMFKAAGMSKRF